MNKNELLLQILKSKLSEEGFNAAKMWLFWHICCCLFLIRRENRSSSANGLNMESETKQPAEGKLQKHEGFLTDNSGKDVRGGAYGFTWNVRKNDNNSPPENETNLLSSQACRWCFSNPKFEQSPPNICSPDLSDDGLQPRGPQLHVCSRAPPLTFSCSSRSLWTPPRGSMSALPPPPAIVTPHVRRWGAPKAQGLLWVLKKCLWTQQRLLRRPVPRAFINGASTVILTSEADIISHAHFRGSACSPKISAVFGSRG